jgi:hypothetical protein
VFVLENLLTKKLKAALATRLRFYQDKELNVTAELAKAAEHNDHELHIVLCADKDETSVDIICRRISCIFMRESRI